MPGYRFSSRTLARSQALQLLFQAQLTGRLVSDVLASDYVTTGDPSEDLLVTDGTLDPYARELALGADAHLHELDGVLDEASRNWAVSRMPLVDLNLLRLAVYEMACVAEVDVAVSINEFVELAKAYGTDESARFVNGLLGRVARMLDEGLTLDEPAEGEDEAELEDAPEASEQDAEPEPEPIAEGDAAAEDNLPAWAREA